MTQPQLTDSEYRLALLAVLGRIAGALEAAKPAEPETITLPIALFKTFDYAQIGCRVFAEDEFGVAQIFSMAEGRVYTRRTNDKFGSEIWFSRGDGKNPDNTPRYKRLIEFRELGNAEPIGRKAEQALKHAPEVKAPALNPPVATLGERMTAQQPATTQPARTEIPTDLRKDWLHWHDQAAKFGPVPAELGLYDVDTIASVKDKIAALVKLYESNVTATINAAGDQLAALLAEAKQAGVDVPQEFFDLDHATLDVIELRIGTVKNLLATKQCAQTMTAPATQQQQQIAGVAGQQIITTLQDMAAKSAQRTMSQSMSFDTVSALEHIAGSEPMRHSFCQRVFGTPKFADLKDPQRYALFSWLKPARASGSKAQPTNPKASHEFAAVMAMPEVPA